MTKELLDFIVNSVRKEEQQKQERENEHKAKPVHCFTAEVKAGDLVEPCKVRAAKHREREAHYTKALEAAEKELRDKGISLEVFDQNTQTYGNFNAIASGALSAAVQTFQPRVDQKLMDNVKNAKNKMLEHREKAEGYEKQAKAYAYNPGFLFQLTVDQIHYFGL